eukprot:scaffold33407_cov112-Isochrysis_galbana.AAC.3
MPQARRLPSAQDATHLLVGKGGDDDGARRAVGAVDAVPLQLIAQHVGRLVVAPRPRLLALHQNLLHLLLGETGRTGSCGLLRMRRGHIGDRDGSRPPVCGLPPTLLCSKVHTVFLQLVAQPVGRLEVPSAARLLTLAHKFLNVRIGEARPARRARRLLRVHLRHVHGQDRSRSAIGGAPRAALIINRDAKLGQLLAQPISRIEIPGEARLLALHHERSHLLVYRTSTSGALLDERHRHGLGRCGRHGQLDRTAAVPGAPREAAPVAGTAGDLPSAAGLAGALAAAAAQCCLPANEAPAPEPAAARRVRQAGQAAPCRDAS